MIGGSEDDAPPGMVERVRANLGRYASLGGGESIGCMHLGADSGRIIDA